MPSATPSRLPAAARVAAIASALIIAQQVAGKATRDALFLSHFSATKLPPMMGVAAVASLFVAAWLARVLTRYTPARVVPLVFGVGSAVLLALWGLSFVSPRSSAIALYLYTAIFGASLISAFWSLVGETFDPHTSRRAMTAITSGGALGGLLGGLAAWRLSSLVAVPTMLPLLAALNAVSAWGTLRVGQGATKSPLRATLVDAPPAGEPLFPFRVLREAPYLRNLAIIVALGAVVQGLLDYVFNAAAARSFARGPALLSFFAIFWAVVGVLSFVRQAALGRFMLRRLGVTINIALSPAIVLLGSAVCLVAPGLPSISLLRGGEAMQYNSYFRAAYEMLYTPLGLRQRRAVKTVIDVGYDRLGTLIAAGLAWAAVWLVGARAGTALLVPIVVCSLASLARSRPLHRGYVSTLEERLRLGAGDDEPSNSVDPASGAADPRQDGATVLVAKDQSPAQDLSLEHLFDQLALNPDHGSVAVAFRVLHTGDQRLRGTALEYLETVLPSDIRDAVWPSLLLLYASSSSLPTALDDGFPRRKR
jgi:AAA family ATP:ADP antiporter